MHVARREANRVQQVAQHPDAGERVLQVQPVDEAHQRLVRGTHRPWLVVDAATVDPERLGLPGEG
jgi:hypothetical protein